MIDKTCGVISAAAAPCSARAPISTDDVGARPPISDAAVNVASPSPNARLRPRMSPSRAPVTTSAANAIVYIATTS